MVDLARDRNCVVENGAGVPKTATIPVRVKRRADQTRAQGSPFVTNLPSRVASSSRDNTHVDRSGSIGGPPLCRDCFGEVRMDIANRD